jgi:hypothetical protein
VNRYTLTINPAGAGYIVRGPDAAWPFPTLARAIDFMRGMNAIEADITRIVRCYGLAANVRIIRGGS